MKTMEDFKTELQNLLNRYCAENESNTPDFVLAEFLLHSLQGWNCCVNQREKWFGRPVLPPGATKALECNPPTS